MAQYSNAYMNSSSTSPHPTTSTHVQNYEPRSPTYSMSDYARIMHEHTKHQLSTATNSARRRSQGSSISSSSAGSVQSPDS